jgi:hypothetical protein
MPTGFGALHLDVQGLHSRALHDHTIEGALLALQVHDPCKAHQDHEFLWGYHEDLTRTLPGGHRLDGLSSPSATWLTVTSVPTVTITRKSCLAFIFTCSS